MEQSMSENFFIFLPFNVLADRRLKDIDKLVYAEISSLTRKNGVCIATNMHFQEVLNISESKLQRSLARLEEESYIKIAITHVQYDKVGTWRHITLNTTKAFQVGGVSEMTTGGSQQRLPKRDIHKENILLHNIGDKKSPEGVSFISNRKRGEGFGNENLNRLKTFLMEKYPIKGLDGIADRRALFNLMQVCNPRKGQDEWMNPDWKENFKAWYRTYAESMQGKEEYMVRSVRALKDKIKDWRERGGK